MKLNVNMLRKLIAGIGAVLLFNVGAPSARAEDATEKVSAALSGYHFDTSAAKLEEIAGGKDQLVAALLTLRTSDALPFVGIRAEKLLLEYSDRKDVQDALLADIASEKYKGLARTVTMHLDRATTPAVRQALARAAVERAKGDAEFMPYAKAMVHSTDPEVQRMARGIAQE